MSKKKRINSVTKREKEKVKIERRKRQSAYPTPISRKREGIT